MLQISTTKLIILAVLGLVALISGSVVLTLQIYVGQLKRQLNFERFGHTYSKSSSSSSSSSSSDNNIDIDIGIDENSNDGSSIQYSKPTSLDDLFLSQKQTYPPPQGTSYKTIGHAYWKQAASFLRDWDPILSSSPQENDEIGSSSSSSSLIPKASEYTSFIKRNGTATAYPRLALERAAKAGHPLAQHYLANAYASGIWPVPASKSRRSDGKATDDSPQEAATTTTATKLHVLEEWIPTAHGNHAQVTQSFALWHMAAMGGNSEAANTLAYRLEHYHQSERYTCMDVLPYYEAAAHIILDELEASLHSRAKVIPPMDKHTLAQVHMHGGTSSQLEWYNKPHESKEALQFYHLKATTTPWTVKGSGSSSDSNDPHKTREATIDVQAAYTLGYLYHYGLRGVAQNLTLSLQYYEIAGTYGHWESAGRAGTFHLWGMGVPQNMQEAMSFFKIGAPHGLDGCRRKHEQAIVAQAQGGGNGEEDEEDVLECDDESLTGLGLLHLLGIPGQLNVNLVEAEKYFTLAKEMGNIDAMYNLAMMWLGWKTHFKRMEDLQDDGMSHPMTDLNQDITGNRKAPPNFALHISQNKDGEERLFKGPLQSEIMDAVKLLTVAANKGHLQSKHRLGMLYSQGVKIQTAALKYEAVKKDCPKAKAMYQWVAENASLSRSKRLRAAYQDYMAGNLDKSLRNYLALAETGSSVGQVNAAFLLERGTCLDLSSADCAKASVRLWKAAAARGHSEASLRVGDFYYYGRLRVNSPPAGPFGWVQHVLYPEEFLPPLLEKWGKRLWNQLQLYLAGEEKIPSEPKAETKKTCEGEDCQDDSEHEQELADADLAMAAHYYQVAVEKHHSPRANFNLGFMHEWGLGLKQDFPLAKRHYDLATTTGQSEEAVLAVKIALMAMNSHEYVVKSQVAFDHWWSGAKKKTLTSKVTEPRPATPGVGQPVPGTSRRSEKTKFDVIISHVFDWSSLVIAVLLFVVVQIMELRARRQRR